MRRSSANYLRLRLAREKRNPADAGRHPLRPDAAPPARPESSPPARPEAPLQDR